VSNMTVEVSVSLSIFLVHFQSGIFWTLGLPFVILSVGIGFEFFLGSLFNTSSGTIECHQWEQNFMFWLAHGFR